ncbi:MAG TPA: hypothetical protein VND65_06580, partial [Candidatus Binatia bacterium]|nr:hypothetical protein [Candidatus Binatia bacterium]
IVLRDGKRVVITDPKDIRDPLSDVMIRLAKEIRELRENYQHHSHIAPGTAPDGTNGEQTHTQPVLAEELFLEDYHI